jgi:hypothetical protein
MKALHQLATGHDETANSDTVFCLRQTDSETFWNGLTWVDDAAAAKTFSDLDVALSVAHRTWHQGVDLLVMFPTTRRSLRIPLGTGKED